MELSISIADRCIRVQLTSFSGTFVGLTVYGTFPMNYKYAGGAFLSSYGKPPLCVLSNVITPSSTMLSKHKLFPECSLQCALYV